MRSLFVETICSRGNLSLQFVLKSRQFSDWIFRCVDEKWISWLIVWLTRLYTEEKAHQKKWKKPIAFGGVTSKTMFQKLSFLSLAIRPKLAVECGTFLKGLCTLKAKYQIRYRGVSNTKQECMSLTIKNLKNSKKKCVSARTQTVGV